MTEDLANDLLDSFFLYMLHPETPKAPQKKISTIIKAHVKNP